MLIAYITIDLRLFWGSLYWRELATISRNWSIRVDNNTTMDWLGQVVPLTNDVYAGFIRRAGYNRFRPNIFL